MIDNGDGTVTDEVTGLIWQKKTAEIMSWGQTTSYCKGLNLAGSTDWRLPTLKELISLVEYNKYKPSINIECFPDTVSAFYWSSTTHAFYTSSAWGVDFSYGYNNDYNKKNACHYVRAVRRWKK